MAENPEDMQRRIEELLKVLGDKSGALSTSLEKLNARVGTASTEMEKNRRMRSAEKEVLEEAKVSLKEYARQLDQGKLTQQEYDKKTRQVYEEIAKLKDLTGDQKKQIIENIAVTRKKAEAEVYAEKITGNFNKAVEKTTNVLAPVGNAIGGIWKGSQNATNAISGTTDIFRSQVALVGTGTSKLGEAVQSTSSTLLSSNNKFAKGLGIAGTIAGAGLQQVGKSSELISSVYGTLAEKALELQNSYVTLNQSGAAFAGGMSELRNAAGSAGVKVTDLTGGITQAQEAFQAGGLSITQATKMIGNFGKGLSQGRQATELFSLGFVDVQDRIRLAGSAFDQARAAGMSRAEAERNISTLTVQYAKDLKVLQGIAGKDAEKALEKGRIEAQRGALMNKLNEDQRTAFSQVFASLSALGPEAGKVQLALTQLANNGVVTDPDILVNRPMMEMITQMANIVRSGSKTAIDEAGAALGQAAEQARLGARTGETMSQIDSTVIQLGKNADGFLSGMASLNNALLTYKLDPETGKQQRANIDQLTTNTDAITTNLGKLDQRFRDITVNLEQLSLSDGVMGNFTKLMELSLAPLQGMINKVKEFANLDMSKILPSGGGGSSSLMEYSMLGLTAAGTAAQIAGSFRGGGPTPPTGPTGPNVPPGGPSSPSSPTGPKIPMAGAPAAGSVPNIPTPGATGASGAASIAESGLGKNLSGAATKIGGKTLGKMIPGVGLVMSGVEAYEKVQQGDYVGAALSGAGGLASMIPGLGTAASALLSTMSAIRDITPSITPVTPQDLGAATNGIKEETPTPGSDKQSSLDAIPGLKALTDQIQLMTGQTKDTSVATTDLLSRLNQNMEDLIKATRDVVTNTDRTARGVT